MLVSDEEYERFLAVFPRVCVDILVQDGRGRVLLLKRTNEPASGQWWFPGGRVYIGETRFDAARRKLWEECRIDAPELVELGSRDLFFQTPKGLHHDVTIVFRLEIPSALQIFTDSQSSDFGWFAAGDCQDLPLHPYLRDMISLHGGRVASR